MESTRYLIYGAEEGIRPAEFREFFQPQQNSDSH